MTRRALLVGDGRLTATVAAVGVGAVAGLGAVAFRVTIWLVQEAAYGSLFNPGSVEFGLVDGPNLFDAVAPLGPGRFVLVPAVGGLLVGVVVYLTTTEVSGHGVPKVLEAILVRGGRIDPRIAVYKTVASSVAIGTGGALGREGPIAQIGSAAGSFVGRRLGGGGQTRTLVAAGAAGGIAATFNAPLGGITFALEILLAEFYLGNVVVIVLSTVTATAIARILLNFAPGPGVAEFLVPVEYELVSPLVEFPLYVVLGVVVAVAGAAVVKSLYATEHAFDALDAPIYVKPAVGGALLGVSALVLALVWGVAPLRGAVWLFGVGYGTIREAILGDFPLALLVVLAGAKTLAFSLSVGSGSSGGVFSPSLYVGAMVGGAFGVLVGAFVPGTAGPGAYALVGMAGLFAAVAQAPLTATLILFELTGQYTILLPVLLVSVLESDVSSRLLTGGTIYTQKLRERGVTVQERRIGSVENATAGDVMTTPVATVRAGASIATVEATFRRTGHGGLPVVDDGERLVGIVSRSDLDALAPERTAAEPVPAESDAEESTDSASAGSVESVMTTHVYAVAPDENLLAVVDLMVGHRVHHVPVVADGVVVGIVTPHDVLAVYDVVEPLASDGSE
ncbi:MAG: chloride channel protein [Haloplanus sp.]